MTLSRWLLSNHYCLHYPLSMWIFLIVSFMDNSLSRAETTTHDKAVNCHSMVQCWQKLCKLGLLVLVPGPRPKIDPSRHIEGNLLSNIPNESSGPENFRSASNFFGSRVENGLKGAYCSEPPATWQRLPSALQAHSTLSGYDSGLVCWNSII